MKRNRQAMMEKARSRRARRALVQAAKGNGGQPVEGEATGLGGVVKNLAQGAADLLGNLAGETTRVVKGVTG